MGTYEELDSKLTGQKMAKNTSLYFRIVEGRNLPAKDV